MLSHVVTRCTLRRVELYTEPMYATGTLRCGVRATTAMVTVMLKLNGLHVVLLFSLLSASLLVLVYLHCMPQYVHLTMARDHASGQHTWHCSSIS